MMNIILVKTTIAYPAKLYLISSVEPMSLLGISKIHPYEGVGWSKLGTHVKPNTKTIRMYVPKKKQIKSNVLK
jgi:hypothetical protein